MNYTNLNKEDLAEIADQGRFSKQDLQQINDSFSRLIFRDEKNKRISKRAAFKKYTRRNIIIALTRAAFHGTATVNNPNSDQVGYIEVV